MWAGRVAGLLLGLLLGVWAVPAAGQQRDSERLGMAIDYFRGGKYHEAMLLLHDLDGRYRLNPRFRAYLGVCYYYEWQYDKAAACLDSVIPRLRAFAPQERAFYCYAAAESHFALGQYDRAQPLYHDMLQLCAEAEKGDAYYRLGLIHASREEWLAALDNLQSALVYYGKYRPGEKARMSQARTMITGCCRKIDEERAARVEQPTVGEEAPAPSATSP